jgi:hypothetical protein
MRACDLVIEMRPAPALLNLGMNLASTRQIWETGCSQSPPNYSPAGIQERGLAPAAFKKRGLRKAISAAIHPYIQQRHASIDSPS